MKEPILITTTVERQEQAEDIARALLDKRLVACAQIHGPIKSMYWWKQDVAESVEFVLTLKTFVEHYPAVEATIHAAHPYDVPEIIAQQLTRVSPSYLAWMHREVTG